MSSVERGCITPARLDSIGAGHAATEDENAHAATCDSCRGELDEARDNAAFLTRIGHDLSIIAGDESPALAPAIPGYEIGREIGRGGQGVVWEGVQTSTRRRVAIKAIAGGSRRGSTRLEREGELVASLRHEGIVSVYESRVCADGTHVVIMEFVEGSRLDQWGAGLPPVSKRSRASAVQRLDAFSRLCDAVDYAHRNGVIHRDLKPANILVDHHDQPRVLDFGVAKRTVLGGDTLVTAVGSMVGTLAYASPEQVSGDPDRIDTRSDVYSLGVILYELLTGRRPYDVSGSLSSALAMITTGEPAPAPELNNELATLVAVALAKDPARRYQSAGSLGRDVRRYLAGAPIDAKRDSAAYVGLKFVQRHRVGAGIAALSLIAFGSLVVSRLRAGDRLRDTNTSLESALVDANLMNVRMLAGSDAGAAERKLWPVLDEFNIRNDRFPAILTSPEAPIRSAAWAYVEIMATMPRIAATHVQGPLPRCTVSFDPSDERVFIGNDRGQFDIRRTSDLSLIDSRTFDLGSAHITNVMADGNFIAATDDRWQLRDGATGAIIGESMRNDSAPWNVVISPRGDMLAVTYESEVLHFLRLPSMEMIRTFSSPRKRLPAFDPPGDHVWVFDTDWSFVGYSTDDLTLPPVETRKLSSESFSDHIKLEDVPTIVGSPAAGPFGALALGLDNGFTISERLGKPFRFVGGIAGGTNSLAFSPDGTRIAVAGNGSSSVTILSRPDLRVVARLDGHDSSLGVAQPIWSSDSTLLATKDGGSVIRLWSTGDDALSRSVEGSKPGVTGLGFAADGGVMTCGSPGSFQWGKKRFATLAGHDKTYWSSIQEVSGGEALILGAIDGTVVRVRESSDGALDVHQTWVRAPGPKISCVRVNAAGTRAIVAATSPMVSLLDAANGALIATADLGCHRASFAHWAADRDVVLVSTVYTDRNKTGKLWCLNGTSLLALWVVDAHIGGCRAVDVTPDGRLAISVGSDGMLRVWDTTSGAARGACEVDAEHLYGVSCHPSGHIAAVASRSGKVSVVDLKAMRVIATFDMKSPVYSVAFSADGWSCVVGLEARPVEIIDFAAIAQRIVNSTELREQDASRGN